MGLVSVGLVGVLLRDSDDMVHPPHLRLDTRNQVSIWAVVQ